MLSLRITFGMQKTHTAWGLQLRKDQYQNTFSSTCSWKVELWLPWDREQCSICVSCQTLCNGCFVNSQLAATYLGLLWSFWGIKFVRSQIWCPNPWTTKRSWYLLCQPEAFISKLYLLTPLCIKYLHRLIWLAVWYLLLLWELSWKQYLWSYFFCGRPHSM